MTTDTKLIIAAIIVTICAFLTTCGTDEIKDAKCAAAHKAETIASMKRQAELKRMEDRFNDLLALGKIK